MIPEAGRDGEALLRIAEETLPARSSRQSETSSLERRVLAHERILQALIAHMAEVEPKFLERLSERFSDPIGNGRSEHAHVSTDAYADAFIAAVVRLGAPAVGAGSTLATSQQAAPDRRDTDTPAEAEPAQRPSSSTRVSIRKRSGVWEVRLDGTFFGDYPREQEAFEVSTKLISLMTSGTSR